MNSVSILKEWRRTLTASQGDLRQNMRCCRIVSRVVAVAIHLHSCADWQHLQPRPAHVLASAVPSAPHRVRTHCRSSPRAAAPSPRQSAAPSCMAADLLLGDLTLQHGHRHCRWQEDVRTTMSTQSMTLRADRHRDAVPGTHHNQGISRLALNIMRRW